MKTSHRGDVTPLNDQDLRDLKQIEFDMLCEFDRICKKHDIPYYISDGTALGAVRHGGFIPWDDDIDVSVIREDYDRVLRAVAEDLDPKYFLQTQQTDPEYPLTFAKIRANGTAFIERSIANVRMHHGIYIDIFPIDAMPKTEGGRRRQMMWFRMYWGLIKKREPKNPLKVLLYKLLYATVGRERLIRFAERQYHKYPIEKTLYRGNIAGDHPYRAVIKTVPKEWFGSFTEMPFEGKNFPVLLEYDRYLTMMYGDYMQLPPEEKRVTVHPTVAIDPHRDYKTFLPDVFPEAKGETSVEGAEQASV